MAKIRHRAEHDGLVFTRNSDHRRYSHVVLRPISLDESLARAEEGARWDWKTNQAYHQGYADGSSPFLVKPDYFANMDEARRIEAERAWIADKDRQIQASRAWLAGGIHGLVHRGRAEALRRWREQYPERDTAWGLVGWAGRLDLAQKQAKPGDVIAEAVVL